MKKKLMLLIVAAMVLVSHSLWAQSTRADSGDADESFYEQYETDSDYDTEDYEQFAQQYNEEEPCSPHEGRHWYYLYPMRQDYYSGGGGPAGAGGFWNQYYF